MATSKKFTFTIDAQNNVKVSFNANQVDASVLNNISEIIAKVTSSDDEATKSSIIDEQIEAAEKKTQQVIDVEDEDSLSENESNSQINNTEKPVNNDVELTSEEMAEKLEEEQRNIVNSEYWRMLANDSVNYEKEHNTNINSRPLQMPSDKEITANINKIEAIADPMAFLQMPNFTMPTPEETQNFQMQTETTESNLQMQTNENGSQINKIEEPICSGATISKSAFEQFFGLMDD